MQAPGGPEEDPSGGFMHGGWARDCWDDVMEQVMEEAMAAPYDLLLGRKTYEGFAAHWPDAGNDPPANKLNNATKFVATSTLSKLEWKNSVPITGDIAAEISRLKDQDGPLLQVHGSWQLIQTLLSHGLIDEFRLWDFPRHCWLWETPIRSGHRTDRFDAHKNGYLLDWRDDEHLQARGQINSVGTYRLSS